MAADIKWQQAFDVLPRAASSSATQLQGDKISLPQSALEQLLGAASASATDTALLDNNPRGSQSSLPSPLTFHLSNPENHKEVYAGILEFSAPDGFVAVSPLISDALGLCAPDERGTDGELKTTPKIVVQFCRLQKGGYVRLRPLEAGYDAEDWKALLERQLRNGYTTLTRGLTLSVHGLRNDTFKFLVDKVAPDEPAICVVDTDIEVDIEALDEEQARETLRQLIARNGSPAGQTTSGGGELDVWKSTTGQVPPGAYVDYRLPSWNRSLPLAVSLIPQDTADADLIDLFVSPKSDRQRAAPRQTEHVFGSFAPGAEGGRSLLLEQSDFELESTESILISVHGYAESFDSNGKDRAIPFTIRVHAVTDTAASSAIVDRSPAPSQASAEEEQCRNCMQWVPKQSMVLHQNFCFRNNIPCPQCGAVFKKGSPDFDNHWHCELDKASGNSQTSKQKHDEVHHTPRNCPACEFSTNSLPDLARHRTTVCPGKLILCRFCHLEVPQEGDPFNPSPELSLSGLTAHELADGARTADCHLCHKIIRLRDMKMHMQHHELDRTKRDAPPVCRNINCGRTLHGTGPRGRVHMVAPHGDGEATRTSLGLCAACFGPLYVSMHDPEGKALKRRVERRYLGQMMTGCGKHYCSNEWCRTGRSNQGLDAKPSSAQGVLPLVKPLLADAIGSDSPLYFCVDEGSHKQRQAAELIAAEGAWDQAWTVAAAEAEGGDISRMRDWLQDWAPTRHS